MSKIVGKVVSIVILTSLFTLLMLSISMVEQHKLDYFISKETERFTEQVRYKGYISRSMYETFIDRVAIYPMDIRFYHIERDLVNDLEVLNVMNERKIVDTIYQDEIYKMNQSGNYYKDDFYVYIGEVQPTTFDLLFSSLSKQVKKRKLITSKGGMVYNEIHH